jgi:hypothetical protein
MSNEFRLLCLRFKIYQSKKGRLNSQKIVFSTRAGGVPKLTENAGGLRFRTEDDERVRAHRKSLKSRDKWEKRSWLGSKDSNLDCMIQSHVLME